MTYTGTKQEKISADVIQIGFEFQYYYFLKCVLEMKTNESVGFEVKDDVHIEKVSKKASCFSRDAFFKLYVKQNTEVHKTGSCDDE